MSSHGSRILIAGIKLIALLLHDLLKYSRMTQREKGRKACIRVAFPLFHRRDVNPVKGGLNNENFEIALDFAIEILSILISRLHHSFFDLYMANRYRIVFSSEDCEFSYIYCYHDMMIRNTKFL